MGGTSYSVSSRAVRSAKLGYMTADRDEIFAQNKVRRIHESMIPKDAQLREARDSEAHPNTVPIILALDETGSMMDIPHWIIKEGLPKLMGGLIQKGLLDPALLFLAIGDHECDSYPLQVGQFESGDEELDQWLTRTYLEGGGGGNGGESYLLAWYYAALHTVTDAWEKRKKKGLLFTIGDEPNLDNLPKSSIEKLMGSSQSKYTSDELLNKAQERYEVYHLHIVQGSAGSRSLGYWKQKLGDNCIEVKDYTKIADIITEIVLKHNPISEIPPIVSIEPSNTSGKKKSEKDVEEML
jgi:hypothetical protein